jgi:hypothetical protein
MIHEFRGVGNGQALIGSEFRAPFDFAQGHPFGCIQGRERKPNGELAEWRSRDSASGGGAVRERPTGDANRFKACGRLLTRAALIAFQRSWIGRLRQRCSHSRTDV